MFNNNRYINDRVTNAKKRQSSPSFKEKIPNFKDNEKTSNTAKQNGREAGLFKHKQKKYKLTDYSFRNS